MSFEESIKSWVNIDNQVKMLQDKIKELREKKSDVEFTIYNYAAENNLQKAVIEISDGKLKFIETKTTNPLSLKYVEKCLSEIVPDKEIVKQIMQYIKENRESKVETNIKRTYKNDQN
jgi:hypothetical protein|tara:strand:+ start:357 stop:710 length:354 start_codon:yes stop_codon:yes gene_type:complete